MRRDELRDMLLSLLYTEYVERGKDIWFKSRYLAKDVGISPHNVGRTCSELEEDGIIHRHGNEHPSAWGTCFNTFSDPLL